jgi:hypothetical protein
MTAHIIEQELNEELMLYDMEHDKLHILNDMARLILRLHRQGKTIEEIENTIKQNFRLQHGADIRGNVLHCLQALEEKGIIQAGEHWDQ